MKPYQNKGFVKHQRGAALILFAFFIALAFSFFALKRLNSQDLTVLKQQKNSQALKEAKKALIAWAVMHPNHPGQLPMPDRNGDLNYDGKSDCNSPVSTFNYNLLIGVLPTNGQPDNPCEQPQDQTLVEDLKDSEGNHLWYAVSRNLIHKYDTTSACITSHYTCIGNTGDPVINPITMNAPFYPWMRVFDRNGILISDRVAAVIIAPGNALSNQNRTAAAPAGNEFLDSLQVTNIGAFSNADYDTPDEDFVMGQDSSRISQNDNTYAQPYLFNDQLIYITIDELMPYITQRAAAEASGLLRTYQASTGQFPWAANLGQALHNHYGNAPNQSGILPVDVTDTCSCTSATSCSCSFGLVQSIELRRTSGTWSTALDTGACSSAVTSGSQICRCTGAGSCSRFATSFTCDAAGNCSHTGLAGTNTFTFTTQPHMDIFSLPTGGRCLPWPVPTEPTPPACNTTSLTAAGSFTVGLRESYWFKENAWQDFFHYQWSTAPNIAFGSKTGLSAILIGMGRPLALTEQNWAQNRPSSDLRDYLDTANNTGGDNSFEDIGKRQTDQYNDLPFVVSP